MNPSVGNFSSVLNFLAPVGGQMHVVPITGVFSATPFVQNWTQFKIDNYPFIPQGYFADNTQGTGDLVITILPLGYTITIPAGASGSGQFPAPNGQSVSITGSGQASVYFVDFPVLPGGNTQVTNTVNVNVVSPDPLPVQGLPDAAGGIPYSVQESLPAATAYQASITGAATTATITPAANTDLRRLTVTFSGDAALGAAGEQAVTVTLNGATIAAETLWLGAPGANVTGLIRCLDLDASLFGLNAAAGDLVVTLGTALSSGKCSINAYFA